MRACEILRAADKVLGKDLGGLVASDARPRKAIYDRRRKFWIVEYDTDPAIAYRAYEASDGSTQFERIDD